MVAEARRIAAFGWTTVVIRPNPVRGRSLGHPDYAPFWQACEQLRQAVAVHEGTHARLVSAGADRFDSRFGMHACSHTTACLQGRRRRLRLQARQAPEACSAVQPINERGVA